MTMDADLATLVLGSVTAASNSASQEAGKQAWQGLVGLVRRARQQPDAVVEPAHAESLAATLIEAAGCDPEFATDLRSWIDSVGQPAGRQALVSNTVGDGAQITGNVVQASVITGPITFR